MTLHDNVLYYHNDLIMTLFYVGFIFISNIGNFDIAS